MLCMLYVIKAGGREIFHFCLKCWACIKNVICFTPALGRSKFSLVDFFYTLSTLREENVKNMRADTKSVKEHLELPMNGRKDYCIAAWR